MDNITRKHFGFKHMNLGVELSTVRNTAYLVGPALGFRGSIHSRDRVMGVANVMASLTLKQKYNQALPHPTFIELFVVSLREANTETQLRR
jgi:hypothetical protein